MNASPLTPRPPTPSPARRTGPAAAFTSASVRLRDGARRRARDTVAAITQFSVADIDFKDIAESPEEVDAKLRRLPLTPSEVRNSGGGRHVIWTLDVPVEPDDLDFPGAEFILRRVTELLCW